jgi:sulfur relay protein TusB/DsrH
MATLHLISNPQALASCLTVAGAADTLVLLEDGVYAATILGEHAQGSPSRCFTLATDIAARGLPAQANDISYEQLVVLCTEHQPITTWC